MTNDDCDTVSDAGVKEEIRGLEVFGGLDILLSEILPTSRHCVTPPPAEDT
jgi:hypothetical protein